MTIAVFVENRPFFGALLVHAPFLHALRERHPGARLVLFSPFAEAEMLVRLGLADHVRLYGRDVAAIARALREEGASAVYSLRPFSSRIDLAVGLSGVTERVGYRSPLGRLLFSRAVPHDTSIYRPRKYLALLRGGPSRAARWCPARRAPLDRWFRTLLSNASVPERERVIGVLPGGGAGAFKLWGIDNFLAACARLAERDPDLRFAFVLGRAEADMRERIEASSVARRSVCLIDEPVGALARVAFGALAAMGNDCGPGHLFQMCGCPYVCVMSDHDGAGPTRIAEWVDEPNRAFAVTPATGADIRTIPAARVAERVGRAATARDRKGATVSPGSS